MKNEGKKVRQHTLTDKHPFISSIIMMLLAVLIMGIVVGIVRAIYPKTDGSIGLFFGTIVVLLLYHLWFKGEFTGFLKNGQFSPVFPLVIAYIVYIMADMIPSFIKGEVVLNFAWARIATSLAAGLLEECVFRGIMTTTLLRKRKNDSTMSALVVSSVCFGVFHLVNIISGADPRVALTQVVSSICLGLFFGATYIITGNLAIPIAFHFLQDVIALGFSADVTDEGIMIGAFTMDTVIGLIFPMGLAVFVIYYMKRQKSSETAREIWNKKWILEVNNEREIQEVPQEERA